LDKLLPNILILPAYTAAKFRDGKHRGERIKSMQWNSDKWSTIKSNQNPRFHYIKLNEKFQVPELVIDFKHVYTLNRELAYKGIKTFYFISMAELFREQISQRYTNYLGRIGLPDQSVA
jgi:hypothetical protein